MKINDPIYQLRLSVLEARENGMKRMECYGLIHHFKLLALKKGRVTKQGINRPFSQHLNNFEGLQSSCIIVL
jgi:hypothetical protein